MRRGFALALAILLALPAGEAIAQSDWGKAGQNLLKSLTGKPKPDNGAGSATAGQLSVGDISAGLKQALEVGVGNVVGQLGQQGGFLDDQAIRIPLPENLATVRNALSRVGMAGMMDDLELKLNRAAEAATPKVKEIFMQAISDMTLEDARGILNGPDDAATQYFRGRMSPALRETMRPTVDQTLSEVGAIRTYDTAIERYRTLPYAPNVRADLTEHTLDGTLGGIFHYLAKEEAAIRQEPAKRTTDLLRKVFGG